MRVAGGLVTPDYPVRNAMGLAATLSQAPPGAVRVPALDDAGLHVSRAARTSRSAARRPRMAIYHNALRDLVTWHGVAGSARGSSADAGPAGPGRPALRHALQGPTTIVFWQEGPILMAITSALPAEQVMAIAAGGVVGARP